MLEGAAGWRTKDEKQSDEAQKATTQTEGKERRRRQTKGS